MHHSLARRLRAAGVEPSLIGDPQEAFLVLLEAEGDGATLDDRLALEAAALGVDVGDLPVAARRRAVEGFYGQRWDGFEIVGSERRDPIEIHDYDPEWPHRFAAWKERLATALGPTALRIEHVGSTAVPGLAAKPIVDIQVSVSDLEDESAYVPQIEAAGVAMRSRDAEHRYFRPAPGLPRDVQVHVCVAGGSWQRDHLEFRDRLRANDDLRDEYATLKRDLAERFPDDRLAYTEAKTEFVHRVLGR